MLPSAKTLVIIDSNAVIHRSYHALPPLTAPDGRVVNAVYGYAALLLKVLREVNPDHVVATFDLAGPTFRHEAFAGYKAGREKAPDELYAQIPLVKEVLGAFRIPVLEAEGFEADDAIGTVTARVAGDETVRCVIVTGDMDTLQLVSDRVSVYTLKSGLKEAFIYTPAEVAARFGGLSPAHMPDLKGLKGDASDNIPGVPGIGEVTAVKLLSAFGSLEGVYAAVDAVPAAASTQKEKKKKKAADVPAEKVIYPKPLTEKLVALLREWRDQAFFSRELATINRDAPIDFSLARANRAHYDRASVVALLRSFGFMSLIERLPAGDSSGAADAPPSADAAPQGEDAGAVAVPRTPYAPAEPLTTQLLAGMVAEAEADPTCVHVEVETLLGSEVERMLVIARGAHVGYATWREALTAPLREPLEKLLGVSPVWCHDGKDLWHRLHREGMAFPGPAHDTRIALELAHPNARDTSLRAAVLQELGEEMKLVADDALRAGEIADALFRLGRSLTGRLERQGLARIYADAELPLVPVLADMEAAGIAVDLARVEALRERFAAEVAAQEAVIHRLAGGAFNVNSVKDMREVLFTKLALGAKGLRKTAGGVVSTQASELEKLKDAHPIVPAILAYREAFKIKTTYLDALPVLVGSDGRVHTTFQQLGAATGRMSSQDPNLQNIPVRGVWGKDLRGVFVAPQGHTLLAADYSQIELRVVAHLSGDAAMQAAFREGVDIHARTAALIFGVTEAAVTPDQRAQAKTLNFGVLYGMGPQAFAEAAGVALADAKQFIAGYFREFAGVARYLEATKEQAASRGYVETLFGRRRAIPEVRSQNVMVRRAGERMAVNMPVQGTAADLMKLAMVRVARRIAQDGLADVARLLLQVHDELVLEVRRGSVEIVARAIREELMAAGDLTVPLVVECKAGDDWGRLIPLAR